jgi:hypothetical protein
MISFTTTIKKFEEQGEKTGWTYIDVPASIAQQLKAGTKTAFRVKGKLDDFIFEKISLAPMGSGHFILPLNEAVRKKIGKQKGAFLQVQLTADESRLPLPPAFIECLKDEPDALDFFNHLPMSHQNYFVRWLSGVKGEEAVAKRLAQAVTALAKKQNFADMIKSNKQNRKERLG